MTSPVEIIAAHRLSSRRHIKNNEYLVNRVACYAEGCTWETEWVRDESERIKLHAAHVAAALEEARRIEMVEFVDDVKFLIGYTAGDVRDSDALREVHERLRPLLWQPSASEEGQ